MPLDGIDAYPLCWPEGWARTKYPHQSRYRTTFGSSRDKVLHSLKLMNVIPSEVVLSTNVPLRRDGLPYSNVSEPKDPGVAVYWMKGKQPQVIACDHWRRTWENMHAIWFALESLRALERCGATQILERAFTGFAALPAAHRSKPWREVLGIDTASRSVIEQAFKELALIHHPDRGGSHERMAEITRARDEALAELEQFGVGVGGAGG